MVADSIGSFPYPFLNWLTLWQRVQFYCLGAGLFIVLGSVGNAIEAVGLQIRKALGIGRAKAD